MNRAYHPVLHEVRDDAGRWVTGWLPYGQLAALIGTKVNDLMRRLTILGVVERRDGRNRLTAAAKAKNYGMINYRRSEKGRPRLAIDVILPEGMTLLVQNLEATNLPRTEVETMTDDGLSQRVIASRLGITQKAVQKRLAAVPPRLKNWPVLGSWDDDADDLSVCMAAMPKDTQSLAA